MDRDCTCLGSCRGAKHRMLEDALAIAAERDRNLSNHNDEMRDALLLARDALDRLMGDSDLEEDDSIEQRAMRAIARALGGTR